MPAKCGPLGIKSNTYIQVTNAAHTTVCSITVGRSCEVHRRISLVRKGFPLRTSGSNNTSSNVRTRTRNKSKPKSVHVFVRTRSKILIVDFRTEHVNYACYAQDNRMFSTITRRPRSCTITQWNSNRTRNALPHELNRHRESLKRTMNSQRMWTHKISFR